jgi:MFS family permease
MRKLATLLVLYFAQGLPFGFQATALPLRLRQQGVSLQAIGFASLLAAPWLAKAAWAPLVDRFGSRRFGRRKSWIVPMQIGLVLSALAAAQTEDAVALAGLILAMNFFAATQDIAVDALALSWLRHDQLGPATAIQVVGYKLGMLTGGGLLVWLSGSLGWNGLFYAMALLMLGVLVVSLTLREPDSDPAPAATDGERGMSFSELGQRLRAAWQQPATAALIVVVLTYKMGETLADAMWKPLLLDRGFSVAQIGLWSGTFGMVFSLAGSAGSGALVRRAPLVAALIGIAGLRAAGVAAEWWISLLRQPSAAAIVSVTCLEHLVGGALTTVLFALMMRHTDRQIGATHYTLLASLEVWGKLPLASVSGVIASRLGYPALFASATALCVGFSLLTLLLQRRLAAGSGESQPAGTRPSLG